jgi:Fe-S cluster assembly protein SufD
MPASVDNKEIGSVRRFVELFADQKKEIDLIDFPDRNQETWRNTDLRSFLEHNYSLPEKNFGENETLNKYVSLFPHHRFLIFQNGFQQNITEFSTEKIQNITFQNFQRSESAFAGNNLLEKDAFTLLNENFCKTGFELLVPSNTICETPVHAVFSSGVPKEKVFVQDKNTIRIGKNSKISLIASQISDSDESVFSNSNIQIVLEENAELNFILIQTCSEKTLNVTTINIYQSNNSRFTQNILTLKGGLIRNNVTVEHTGENCETDISGLYLPKNEQIHDNHIIVRHLSPHCASRQLFKGILKDKGKAVFRGRVYVEKNAQKTDAFQSNKNLLMSETAKAFSRPQLEIFADDVKCSHGSVTGQMDKDALFYMQTRGIGEKQAKVLLLNAFAKEITDRLTLPEIREFAEKSIENELL